jgi:hypothetical protein
MEDGRIFLKSLRDTSFNKDLSNEPTFGLIHLAGQNLLRKVFPPTQTPEKKNGQHICSKTCCVYYLTGQNFILMDFSQNIKLLMQ